MFKFFTRFASSRDGDPAAEALALLRRGHAAEAVPAFDALLADDVAPERRAFLLNKRGVALARSGRADEARADFERALESRAAYAPALVNLGSLDFDAGRFDEAVARYHAAIEADAGYALAHFNLSAAYKRQGRFADAVRALRTAQKLEGAMRRKKSRME